MIYFISQDCPLDFFVINDILMKDCSKGLSKQG